MNKALYTLIPRRLMSQLMFRLARIEQPQIKNAIIKSYMRITGARTDFAAEKDPLSYHSLNDFFTRALADGARPIDDNPGHIISPVDGRCAIHEQLSAETLLQAKGMPYSLAALLGSEDWAQPFIGGSAATLYLAPDDYHRIHMPYPGTLQAMRFCPGDKHSVALSLLDKIPNIFAGNERAVCLFNTDLGKMAVVMVGALNVSSISTVWHGDVLNAADNTYDYREQTLSFNKGEEIGRFNLGSTVILLFEPQAIDWANDKLECGEKIYMGEAIASSHE
ncbi:archaetidylserine decarboxylase [Suttonella sp. R2A3]|uniref:archaetidylserine decarboxylase n=1 Tax=Suttonella sp. R2A3 TaxID=2908648 RepID=UPI001EEC4578|nr:archaetidylserine decarboxylase [Suttonella sp. R2A3]UJF25113.1 archaetidylserine decarboxylase [Suttonella sp. R2A3]